MPDPIECPGAGKCHGCLKWCDHCGDVTHVCDARLADKRCDEHPMPEMAERLRVLRREAEWMITSGEQRAREGREQLAQVIEDEAAHAAYWQRMAAIEAAEMGRPPRH